MQLFAIHTQETRQVRVEDILGMRSRKCIFYQRHPLHGEGQTWSKTKKSRWTRWDNCCWANQGFQRQIVWNTLESPLIDHSHSTSTSLMWSTRHARVSLQWKPWQLRRCHNTLSWSCTKHWFCLSLTMDLVYSQGAQLQRLKVIKNEGMGITLGCTRGTSAEAMRYLLDLFPMPDRHKVAQVKAFGRVSEDLSNPPTTKLANLSTVA